MEQNKYCANCMNKISVYQDICPYCGFDNSKYTPPSHSLMPMSLLQGRYLIGKVLGSGGFGITYVARDLKVDKKVCIKEFFVRSSMYRQGTTSEQVSIITDGNVSERLYYANLEKFEQEAKILGRFDNVPGIVSVSDYFHENNTAYIVMEYLDGMTLKAYVQSRGGRLTWDELGDKLQPIFASLESLHNCDIYHRDISPDNIMVLPGGRLKLFDFGGARVDTDGHGPSAMIIRKIGYSPIEQYSMGKQGPWTDVYAMAATIYFCLTGKPPADSTDRAGEIDSLERFDALNVKVPKNVERAVYKGLQLKPDDRYQSMEDFGRALFSSGHQSAGVTGSSAGTSFSQKNIPSSGGTQKVNTQKSSRGIILGLIIAVLCVAAGIGGYFVLSNKNTDDSSDSAGSSVTSHMEKSTDTKDEESSDSAEEDQEEVKVLQSVSKENDSDAVQSEDQTGPSEETQSSGTRPETESSQSKESETDASQRVAAASASEDVGSVSGKDSESEEDSETSDSEEADQKDAEASESEEVGKKDADTSDSDSSDKDTQKKETSSETEKKSDDSQKEDAGEFPWSQAAGAESEAVVLEEQEQLSEGNVSEDDIEYIGSYEVITPAGLTISVDSGDYDDPAAELNRVDEARKYVIKSGSILFVDMVCEFRESIWAHTDYYGIRGWFEWPADSLKIYSRNDITGSVGSTVGFVSDESTVKLYDKPDVSSSFNIVTNTEPSYQLEDVDNGWGQITIQDKTGWVEMSDLVVYAENAIYMTGPDAEQNLLVDTNQEAGVLTVVPANTLLYVETLSDGYGKTAYEEYTGWILMKGLTLVGDATVINGIDQYAMPEETVSSMPRDWTMNLLKEEHGATGKELSRSANPPDMIETVFGVPGWNRLDVTGIYVRNTLEGVPENAVDLSAAGDGGVMGWMDESRNLIIAGEGGVKAPENSCALFAYFENAVTIDLGGNLHTDDTTDLSFLFYRCVNAQYINTSGLNTSKATTFLRMFTSCENITELDLSSFDTTNVQTLYQTFKGCSSLTRLDLTSFTTTNVTDYCLTFRDCGSLTQILLDPTRFDTTAARRMEDMFLNCVNLQIVDVTHFNMSNVESTQNMFKNCESLADMDLNWTLSSIKFDEHNSSYGMFENCPLSAKYGNDGEALRPATE